MRVYWGLAIVALYREYRDIYNCDMVHDLIRHETTSCGQPVTNPSSKATPFFCISEPFVSRPATTHSVLGSMMISNLV